MTEQLALSVSAMVSGALSGRGMETMEGFPEEVTSWLTSKGQAGFKREKRTEMGIPRGERSFGPAAK